MVATLMVVVAAGAAEALPAISILWRESGSTLTSATKHATALADVVLTGDSSGVAVLGVFVSIEFDTGELVALGGVEAAAVKLPGMANVMTPLAFGTTVDNVNGLILNFDQATLDAGLSSAVSVTLGSIRFQRNGITLDDNGIDVIASLQNVGVDAIETDAGPGSAIFNGASVSPEPTTAVLVIVGLAFSGYASRRSGG